MEFKCSYELYSLEFHEVQAKSARSPSLCWVGFCAWMSSEYHWRRASHYCLDKLLKVPVSDWVYLHYSWLHVPFVGAMASPDTPDKVSKNLDCLPLALTPTRTNFTLLSLVHHNRSLSFDLELWRGAACQIWRWLSRSLVSSKPIHPLAVNWIDHLQ